MATKTVSGSVTIDNTTVGSVSGSYTDDSQEAAQENTTTKTVSGSVSIDSTSVGSVSGSYTDVVTSDGGGTKTGTVSGSVTTDSTSVGSVSGSYTDDYGAVTQAQNPHFTIVDYTQSVTVQPGAAFTVSVTVKNDGSASGTVTVRLKDYNGTIVDSKDVTLDAGAQQAVQLSATAPSQEGTYTYTVELYNTSTQQVDDSKNVTVTVQQQQAQQPHFKIVTYTGSVTTSPGSTFTVTLGIENDGNASGTVTVRLRDYNGTIVDSKQVTLDAGAQTSVELQGTAPEEPGTYTYTVELYNTSTQQVDDSREIPVTVQAPPQPQPAKQGVNPLLLLGGIILLLLLLSRKK